MNLTSLSKMFPKALPQREITDPWEAGIKVVVRRMDNPEYREWAQEHLGAAEVQSALYRARFKADNAVGDRRKGRDPKAIEAATYEAFELRSATGARIEEQAPGIRKFLIARDKTGPMFWFQDERLTDKQVEEMTTVQYDGEGRIERWVPPEKGYGGQAFELALLDWIRDEAMKLEAFAVANLEDDLGNSPSTPVGGPASSGVRSERPSTVSKTPSTPEPAAASQGSA